MIPPTVKNPFGRLWLQGNGAANAAPPKSGPAKPKILQNIVVGGLTGGIEMSISYPTDYIKTQLQLDSKGAKMYSGSLDCLKKTINEFGITGLYRGMSIMLYGAVPKVAVRFATFEYCKSVLSDQEGNMSMAARFWAGLAAGTMEAVIPVTPMETIKVKFINDRRTANPRYKGFLHGVALIAKESGIRGLYSGLIATMLKHGSNQAIRFYCMENMKEMYRGGDKTKIVPKPVVALMGIVAGIASWLGNNPIDVVKTRMQGLDSHKYKGNLDCIIKIWKQDGPMAFYKGSAPRLIRVCLDVMITFTVYESIIEWINARNN